MLIGTSITLAKPNVFPKRCRTVLDKGNVNLNIAGMQQYKARVAEDTIKMTELWVWNDDTDDYQCVTIADPNVIIYDRAGESSEVTSTSYSENSGVFNIIVIWIWYI